MKVYKTADLPALEPLVATAREMVRQDMIMHRDAGTSVLGAGIAIWYRAPRKRTDCRKILIEAPWQGNTGSQQACKRALEYLRQHGVDAIWYDGRMD